MLCYLYIKFNLPKITNNENLTIANISLYNIGKFYQYGGLYMNNVHNDNFYKVQIDKLIEKCNDTHLLEVIYRFVKRLLK